MEYYDDKLEKIQVSRHRLYLDSDDPSIQDENINLTDGILLNDVFFNGKEIKVSVNVHLNFAKSTVVSLRTVSEDYYKYKRTFQLQQNTSGDPFAQPVNVHYNIQNGFGIFAGFSESRFHNQSSPRPIVTGLNPLKGKPGDHIIISGENFSEAADKPFPVSFNGSTNRQYARAVRVEDHEIEVTIPNDARTGKVVLHVGERIAVSPMALEVTQ